MIEYLTITEKGLEAFNKKVKELIDNDYDIMFNVIVTLCGNDLIYSQQFMKANK